MRFPGEQEDILLAISLAEKWGYGNIISSLQHAWSEKQQKSGFSAKTSDMAAGLVCVWCRVDRRTGKKARK